MDVLQYLTDPVEDRGLYDDFLEKPFRAFLRQAVHLSDAFNHCVRHFPKKKNHEYNKDSLHSMQEIASPLLASLMSNLELFQRSLYARLFDLSRFIPDLRAEKLVENLRSAQVSLVHIVGYRGNPAAAGTVVADALGGWQEPEKVNNHFKALLNVEPFYPDGAAKEIALLWQLRHSIVHTGGTLTVPDSQKLASLSQLGGTPVVFRHQFIPAVVRRFHAILGEVHAGFYPKVQARFKTGYQGEVKAQIDDLFCLESPRRAWLR